MRIRTVLIAATGAAALLTAPAAQAQWYRGPDRHAPHYEYYRGGPGPGPAIAGAVIGLGVGAAIASALVPPPVVYAPPPVYYPPPPVVYAPPPVYYAPPPPAYYRW